MLMGWTRWALLIFPCRLSDSCQIRTQQVTPGWMWSTSPSASARCVALLQSSATQAEYLGHGFVEAYDRRSKRPLLILAPLSKLVTIYHQQSLIRVQKEEVKLNRGLITENRTVINSQRKELKYSSWASSLKSTLTPTEILTAHSLFPLLAEWHVFRELSRPKFTSSDWLIWVGPLSIPETVLDSQL